VWVPLAGVGIDLLPLRQDRHIAAVVALFRGHVANLAVAMVGVVPSQQAVGERAGVLDVGKWFERVLRAVLDGLEQRLDEGVVVADTGPRVAGRDVQRLQGGVEAAALHYRAVVGVQGHLSRGDAFAFDVVAHQCAGVFLRLSLVDLPGNFGLLHVGLTALVELPNALLRWTLGNLLGVAAVVPAIMLMLARGHPGIRQLASDQYARQAEQSLWKIALTTSFLLMAWGGSFGSNYGLGLVALPLTVLVWSAIRFPPLHTALAVAACLLLFAACAGMGLAGFPPPLATLDGLNLLVFLIVVAMLPTLLSFAMQQHRITSAALQRRACIDPLTGLANRSTFEDHVRLELARPQAPMMALAYIDPDQIKVVNDTAGHDLIRGIGGVLLANRHPDDVLARFGCDEFALLLRNCSPMVAEDRVQSLLHCIASYQCGWRGQLLTTSASAGVVTFLPGQGEYAQLLSQADAACFTAKEQGGNRLCLARVDGGELLDRTTAMRWTVRIREALDQHALEIYCQSIVALAPDQQRRRHFEVLMRLRDPRNQELMMPGQFMAVAERFNLGARIDREVVKQTLDWFEANPQAADQVATCCINLSGDATVDEGFIVFLIERLRRSRLPPHRFCFEITETSAVRDLARAQRFITQLRGLGCRFALDDFGTGFCSFNYLRALDVDYFKIDGSFVCDLLSSPLAEAVMRSITEIAHVLHKQCIAEHTESEPLRAALTSLGVDYAQGYASDRPTPIAEYFDKGWPI